MTDHDVAAAPPSGASAFAFGDVAAVTSIDLQVSDASLDAAENLLAKARRSLAAGDRERAGRFVERALALPYNEFEDVVPALWSVHVALHALVSDVVDQAEPGDPRWLDAVLGVFEPGTDGVASAVAPVLVVLLDEGLEPREDRRVRAALARRPEASRVPEFERPGLDDEARRAAVWNSLEASVLVAQALLQAYTDPE